MKSNYQLMKRKKRLKSKSTCCSVYNAKDATGLRLDLVVEDPSNGEVHWLDATAVHTNCKRYVSKEKANAAKRDYICELGR